jgi:hypothetical protein
MDEALTTEPVLDTSQWEVRYNNNAYAITGVETAGTLCTVSVAVGGSDPGPDIVTFAPPPIDLVTLLSNLPVLAFTNYPLT